MQGVIEYSHEYFSEEECGTSSTYRELLGVLRCLRVMLVGHYSVPSGNFLISENAMDSQRRSSVTPS
jgi:hypothetical protein